MKLIKETEEAVLKAYNAYWHSYLKGDMETFASMLDENCHIIGSTKFDIFNNKKDAVDFYSTTSEQIASKADMRNRKITLLSYGEDVMVEEFNDFYFLADNEWHFYGHARLSTLLSKKENGWRIVYQHGSMPDAKTEEGEQIAAEEIAEENKQLRDAIKRRTVELESKNRELEIEAALEKVRSHSLAMHTSDELKDVVTVVFEKLKELNIVVDGGVTISIYTEGSRDQVQWVASPDLASSTRFWLPYTNDKIISDHLNAKESGIDFFAKKYSFEEKNHMLKYLFEHTDFKYVPDDIKARVLQSESYSQSIAFAKKSSIFINSYSGALLSGNEAEILKRFSKVFEQAYIRFLDLEKAELQVREAMIEAALEKVRSRTIAMFRSDEMSDAAATVFHQLQTLGIQNLRRSLVGIMNEEDGVWDCWYTTVQGESFAKFLKMPVNGHPIANQMKLQWLNKETIHVELAGESLKSWLQFIMASGWQYPEGEKPPEKFVIYGLPFSNGYLVAFTDDNIAAAEIELLQRFARVFDQTYTRFLDLQKAEAQAREAKIEASLESVRASSMAMHNSEELEKVVKTLSDKLVDLGLSLDGAAIFFFEKEKRNFHLWVATIYLPTPIKVEMPFDKDIQNNPIIKALWKAIEKGEDFINKSYSGEVKNDYFRFIGKNNESTIPEATREFQLAAEIWTTSFTAGKNSVIMIDSWTGKVITSQDFQVLKRFAKVFEQAYTRFLDLQKAEAQAREAQVETALEKVRSRSIGMQKSEELKEVIQIVYEQFVHLNINVEHTGFIMDYKERDDMHIWLADEHAVPFQITIPYFDCAHWNSFKEALEKGKDFFANLLDFEEKNKFYQDLFKLIPGVPQETLDYYFNCPGLAISTVLLDNVGLYIENFQGIPYTDEENKILMRFGKVFQQTYTRFLDLGKAEAQAREAQVEAALERVRSRSLAMHKSEEIMEVARSVFEKLNELNIELNTAFIIIFKEGSRDSEWWLINRDDQQYARIFVEYNDILILREQFEAKEQDKELFSATYHSKEKYELFRYLFTQTDFKYAPPERQKFIFETEAVSISMAMTKKIAIQITRHDETFFSQEENEILKRFAKVFDQSYTRFLDLQKAEAQAKEAKIEAALERVRSRTLSMQKSDELAETSAVLFKQLIILGIAPNRLYIGVIRDESGNIEFWITDEDGSKVSTMFSGNAYKNGSMKKMYDGWKLQEKSIVVDMHGKELEDYFHYLGEELHVPFKDGLSQKRRLQYIAYFSKGFIGMASPDEQPRETIELLERFASVFNLTFTRFNDLKIAEAHALQAAQDLIEIKSARQKAEDALLNLQAAQKQLVQAEKMASLGELTAGIAHEIQNPLNFVNNFSEVSSELLEEMNMELDKGEIAEAKAIADDVKQNLEKILHHGKRADSIVKGMLQHSRSSSSVKELTDINTLTDEYLRLCYHGMRAKDKSFNAAVKTDFDPLVEKIDIVPQDVGRVILNLLTNAFYAVNEKRNSSPGPAGQTYEPTVSVSTKKAGNHVTVTVSDNGNGIPRKILDKIFQPFFTTKPTGEGTGLGLSLSYDIIKAHGGEIIVEADGEGTNFIIKLPSQQT